jgi:hypothetical protein
VTNRQPIIQDIEIFVDSFLKWWDEINPPWRTRVNNRLKPGGAGPWVSLHKPGQNGFLSVLQCLSWWRGLVGTEGTEDWDSAVEDVLWVLHGVLDSLITPTSNSKRVNKRARDELSSGDIQNDSQAASHTRKSKRIPKR